MFRPDQCGDRTYRPMMQTYPTTIVVALIGALSLLTTCADTGSEGADTTVVATSLPFMTTTSTTTTTTNAAEDSPIVVTSAPQSELRAIDLQRLLPGPDQAADVFMPGTSGEYVVRFEQEIGVDQQTWPWATGFLGGWERSYDLTTDVVGPERRISITSVVLIFESQRLAVWFTTRLARELGDKVEFQYENEYTPFEFITRYKVSGTKLGGKSGAGIESGPAATT